jgi:hypothetical protein
MKTPIESGGNDVEVENVKSVKNGHGFHIISLDGKPVVLFAYETQAEAKAARTHVQAAVEKAVSLLPSASPFRLKTRYFSRRGMCGAKRPMHLNFDSCDWVAFWLPPADALEKFFSTTL